MGRNGTQHCGDISGTGSDREWMDAWTDRCLAKKYQERKGNPLSCILSWLSVPLGHLSSFT